MPDPGAFGVTPVRFRYNQTEVYHVSKASSLRSSPSPLKVGGWCSFAANLVVLSSTGSAGGAGGSAGPASDMLSLLHQQKNNLRPADATRIRTDSVRPMRPVCPDRPPDVFSHPTGLVPPNALIPPPMHPARLLRPPSVPTLPSSFPSSTALV